MTDHLNTLAKLTRPNLAGILPRDRLYKQLDKGREQSIIWVSGPPGSGKTTLVADYLDTWAPECVWYQVDPGDADVATFFYYMAGALPEKSASQPETHLPLFTAEYQSNLPAFTRRYFRELFASLTVPFALVFDNYQDVPSQSRLHEVLRQGLQELPAGGCVIFISRRDPPTAMARFRANDRMQVLDPDDLKLTREESDARNSMRKHAAGRPGWCCCSAGETVSRLRRSCPRMCCPRLCSTTWPVRFSMISMQTRATCC